MLTLAAAPAAADAAPKKKKTQPRVTVDLAGGAARTVQMCGASQRATVAPPAADARAAIRLIDANRMRHGGRHARLVVQRCEDGQWKAVSDERFGTVGKYERIRSYRLPLPTADHGDLRVEAVVRADRRRRAARSGPVYLRIGVGEIARIPLSFAVDNVNRSKVACEADGQKYRVVGQLVGPRAALEDDKRVATLYLHGVEISDSYFHYRGVDGYDFAGEMAERGHTSVTVDRLGHGESDLPNGAATCVGAQADMAHQVIDHLRAGTYRAGGGEGPKFSRMALGGHSFGSFTAEIAAVSFSNYDAFVGMSFAAEGINGPLLAEYTVTGDTKTCTSGGQTKTADGGPGGYATLWPDLDHWSVDTFYNTDPKVLQEARPQRERSPCGELTSAIPVGVMENASYGNVKTPVVLIYGLQDKVFPPPAGQRHQLLFTGSPSVTLFEIDQAGHTLMLQRTAEEFRGKLSGWLKGQGF